MFIELHHLVMNNGKSYIAPEATAGELILHMLRPLAEEGGSLPSPLSTYRVTVNHFPDVCLFTLHGADDPICINLVAWKPGQNTDQAWMDFESSYLSMTDKIPLGTAIPDCPKYFPWLVTFILPGFFEQNRDEIKWLGDFERCMAFALIECRKNLESQPDQVAET